MLMKYLYFLTGTAEKLSSVDMSLMVLFKSGSFKIIHFCVENWGDCISLVVANHCTDFTVISNCMTSYTICISHL
jgi:hypothetical protein